MMIDDYLQQHYSPDTAKAYKREIGIFISNYPHAATALYKDITHYIGALRQRYRKPATLHRVVSSIKVYYAWLCHEGIRNDNPAQSIRLRDQRTRDIQLQDLFTTEELAQLLHRKERYAHLHCRNKVLISLLIYQALYPHEMAALETTHINLQEGTIYIRSTYKTNSRTLSLKPNQILLFHQYLTEIRPKLLQGNSSSALLIGIRSEAMSGEDIIKHVKRSFTNSYPGRKVTAQTIRQSVITNLLKQGHDISIVQAFAGHKYPSSTERYKQHEIATLQAAIRQYHPVQ
jgi:integrase/recombinase XerD